MYAIRNRRTRKWVYGIDYRYWPRHQRTSDFKALLYEHYEDALNDFKWRDCGKQYEIVPVRLEALED